MRSGSSRCFRASSSWLGGGAQVLSLKKMGLRAFGFNERRNPEPPNPKGQKPSLRKTPDGISPAPAFQLVAGGLDLSRQSDCRCSKSNRTN